MLIDGRERQQGRYRCMLGIYAPVREDDVRISLLNYLAGTFWSLFGAALFALPDGNRLEFANNNSNA